MSRIKFNVDIVLAIDEEDNLLPILPAMYEDAVKDLLKDIIYDIDGAEILKIEVKKR